MNDATQSPKSHRPRQLTLGRRVLFAIATPIVVFILKIAWLTYRFRLEEDERFTELAQRGESAVIAFWHEGIMTVGWYAARLLRQGVRMTFLISPSVDGELGTMILASFGSRAVRGSARRSGAAALRGLKCAIVEDRQTPAIAIDGSKGPRRYCKPGAIMVARMAGVPIIPVGFAARRGWRAPTWDRHLVPYPGSKVSITVGEPFVVEREMDAETLEERRRELEDRVNQLMEISEARVGVQTEAMLASAGRNEEDV
jgi:lysophospholipid acyltransferase (LPLAT)-like uncharacterized protein